MDVQTQIDRIAENIAKAYSALSESGVALPAVQNSDNLPAYIKRIFTVLKSCETVDSIAKMTDTSKSDVLSTTGTIWSYGEHTEEKKAENKFDPLTATVNYRHATSALTAHKGYFVSDYMAVDKFAEVDPYIMRIFKSEGVGFEAALLGDSSRIHYFDANKTLLGNKYLFTSAVGTGYSSPHTDENGNIYFHIDECYDNTLIEIPDFDHSQVAFVRVSLRLNTTSTAITAADIENVIITFDADAGTVTETGWYDTGIEPLVSGGGSFVLGTAKLGG